MKEKREREGERKKENAPLGTTIHSRPAKFINPRNWKSFGILWVESRRRSFPWKVVRPPAAEGDSIHLSFLFPRSFFHSRYSQPLPRGVSISRSSFPSRIYLLSLCLLSFYCYLLEISCLCIFFANSLFYYRTVNLLSIFVCFLIYIINFTDNWKM